MKLGIAGPFRPRRVVVAVALMLAALAGCDEQNPESDEGGGGEGGSPPNYCPWEEIPPCSIYVCEDEIPFKGYEPIGTPCSPDGGVCDEWGACVACLSPVDCAVAEGHATCSEGACLTCQGDGTIAEAVEYPVGATSFFVVAGDLNNDGLADLVTASYDSGDVSVLLNAGNGTYPTSKSYVVGTYAASPVLADVNGDGFLDLATVNPAANTVSVLLNNGDGTLSNKKSTWGTGDSPLRLVAADVNADGLTDLVTANASSLTVLVNGGSATFSSKADYPVDLYAFHVAAADLNGDGLPELLLAGGMTVRVMVNSGQGVFKNGAEYGLELYPDVLVLADFNGDGHMDVATTRSWEFDYVLTIRLNKGDGSLSDGVDYALADRTVDMVSGDLNGDGGTDLAVLTDGGGIRILLGTGGGTLEYAADAYSPGLYQDRLAVADMNGDGLADLATANHGSDSVSVLMSTCAP